MPTISLGAMGLSAFYAPTTSTQEAEEQAEAVFDKALSLGQNLIDTAWIYKTPGAPHNEELVGKAIIKHGRDKWIISEKIGVDLAKQPPFVQSEADLREQLESSLARLQTQYVDILFLNRPDPRISIETTMAVLAKFVAEGKAKHLGLSEATPEEIRRAHAVHPLVAIQQEWSLCTRDLEAELLPCCRQLGISIMAYSPLGRGLLSQAVTSRESLKAGDWRLSPGQPRFSAENIAKNAEHAAALATIAQRKGVTPAQLALGWLLAKGGDAVVPIPGTTNTSRLAENAAAAFIVLSDEEVAEIEAAVPEAVGDRYGGMHGEEQWIYAYILPLLSACVIMIIYIYECSSVILMVLCRHMEFEAEAGCPLSDTRAVKDDEYDATVPAFRTPVSATCRRLRKYIPVYKKKEKKSPPKLNITSQLVGRLNWPAYYVLVAC